MLGNTNAKVGNSGGVEILKEGFAVSQKIYEIFHSQTLCYTFFNQNRSKAFRSGYTYNPNIGYYQYFNIYDYNGELNFTISDEKQFTSSPIQTKNRLITVADDDSFVLLVGSGNTYLCYLPINQYSASERILFDTGISFSEKYQILSSTRFVNYNGTSIYIYKLENGAISLEKTISSNIGSIDSLCIANGNICISSYLGRNFQIINPDTEEVIYSESGTFAVTSSGGKIAYKDNLIFVICQGSGASSPESKGIGVVYSCDWSNNTITKLNFTSIPKPFSTQYESSYYPKNIQLIKLSNSLYMVFSFIGLYSFILFDVENRTISFAYTTQLIDLNVYNNSTDNSSGCFLVTNNGKNQLAVFSYASGSPGSTYNVLCDFLIDGPIEVKDNDLVFKFSGIYNEQ